MTRGVGVHEASQSLLPEWFALVLGLLTQLGDVWFLFSTLAALYLLLPAVRERLATVIGIGLIVSVLIEASKHLFDLPRPREHLANPEAVPALFEPLLEATATAGGEGFPSGHATLSTVVFLGLALALPWSTPRRRTGVALGLIALISLTRIGLGVHFLVDVVAGVLLGLTVIAGGGFAVRASPWDGPTTTAGIAVAVGIVGVLVAAPAANPGSLHRAPHASFLALGGALGGLTGWQVASLRGGVPDRVATAPRDATRRSVAVGGVATMVAGVLGGVAIGAGAVAEAGIVALLSAGGVALPGLIGGFDERVDAVLPARIATALGREPAGREREPPEH